MSNIEYETPTAYCIQFLFLLNHIQSIVNDPSDNIVWEDVLKYNEAISCVVPVMADRGTVHCKSCISEVVHICIEDIPVLLIKPNSYVDFKIFETKRHKYNIKKHESVVAFRKNSVKCVIKRKIVSKKIKITKTQSISNYLRVKKIQKNHKLYINIDKVNLKTNSKKSKMLRILLGMEIKTAKHSKTSFHCSIN